MYEEDLEQVHAIDVLSFPHPWSISTYRNELHARQHSRYLVARVSAQLPQPSRPTTWLEQIVQHVVPKPQSAQPSIMRESIVGHGGIWLSLDEGHITTIAVHPDHRGRGIGELIVIGLIDQAYDLGAQQLTLEVRVSNTNAQRLYNKYGFAEHGIRHRYYTDNNEDAVIMWTENIHSASFVERLREMRSRLHQRLRQLPQ
jgi:ribosomal-protein-alanine N-acetyltransferase